MGQITLEIEDAVAKLRLDNPHKLNCIDVDMLSQLSTHLTLLEESTDLNACVVEASNASAFCAGADISDWSALTPREFSQNWLQKGNRVFDRLAQLPMPSLAVINGPVMGGGMELIACCDYRLCSNIATFRLPETGIGVIPGWSGTQRLARLLPEAVLKSMLLFGATVSAKEMHTFGFAELTEELASRRDELLKQLATLSNDANRLAKLMLHGAIGENSASAIDALGGGLAAAGADKQTGVESFKAKKKPDFR